MRADFPCHRYLAAALPLALGACALAEPPEIPTAPPELPESFLFAPDGDTQAELANLLPTDDPAFATLAAAGIESAPDLAEALARIDAARGQAERAGADRLPNITADASVREQRINPQQFGQAGASGLIPRNQTQYGVNVSASWDPDIFGRLRARERAALARIDSATASAAAVRNALLVEIAASVIDWRTLAARKAALKADEGAAQRLAGLAGTREDAGIAPGFDRVRAEAQASASRSRLAGLESEGIRIVGRLVALTGLDAADVAAALALPETEAELAPPPMALPSELLANRPDVLAAAAELTATDADLAAAARARFPRVSLTAVIGLLAFDPADVFESDSIVGNLTAGIAGPLLDFGRIEAEIDTAAAGKRAAFAAYRGAVFQALGDAETAFGLTEASTAEAEQALRERDKLKRAAALAEVRYRAGLADFLTVLEARRAADASGERAAAAVGRARRARILLWQALGGAHAEARIRATSPGDRGAAVD